MQTLGRIVFNITGIMSKKGVVKNSQKIGEAICNNTKLNGGKIGPDDISNIINNVIGKKAGEKIFISTNKELIRKKVLDNNLISSEDLETVFKNSGGFQFTEKYARKANIFVNLDKLYEGIPSLINTLTHEIQHALSSACGTRSLSNILGKTSWGRKILDKRILKSQTNKLQSKLETIEESVINKRMETGSITPEEVIDLLYSKKILKAGDNKTNLYIMNSLKTCFKDEVQAYTVGFDSYKLYTGKEHKARELALDVYNNLVKGLTQETKNCRFNRIKSLFKSD